MGEHAAQERSKTPNSEALKRYTERKMFVDDKDKWKLEGELSKRYEGIIRAVAIQKNTLKEITAFLYGNKLLPRHDSSLIKPYLVNLVNMGILKRIEEFGKRKSRYFIDSPMIDLYYYLDEKYNFSERELERKYYREKIPHHVKFFFRDLLAKMFNKIPVLYITKNCDIDYYPESIEIWDIGDILNLL